MSDAAPSTQVTSGQAVGLVTRREIRTRLRSKAFLISTLIMLTAAVAGVVVTKVVGSISTATDVGFTAATASLRTGFEATAGSVGEDVATRTVSDPTQARRQVRDGDLDVLVDGTPAALRVVVKSDLDDGMRVAFDTLARQHVLNREILRAGGEPEKVNRAVAAAGVTVQPLEPADEDRTQRLLLGMIAGVLVYLSLLIYGGTVAQGVIEEKSSRIVELLLTAIRPWQLMAGKVLGIGLVGLLQIVSVTAVGAGAGLAAGVIDLPTSDLAEVALWALVWYLVGFFMYALMFAAAGALVSRQEDAGAVTGPMTMLIIIPYVLGISLLPANPDNGFIEILSMLPLCSPTLMPMRVGIGVPAWQLAVALGVNLLTIGVLVRLAGTIYGNAVLRVGSRVKLGHAFRAS